MPAVISALLRSACCVPRGALSPRTAAAGFGICAGFDVDFDE